MGTSTQSHIMIDEESLQSNDKVFSIDQDTADTMKQWRVSSWIFVTCHTVTLALLLWRMIAFYDYGWYPFNWVVGDNIIYQSEIWILPLLLNSTLCYIGFNAYSLRYTENTAENIIAKHGRHVLYLNMWEMPILMWVLLAISGVQSLTTILSAAQAAATAMTYNLYLLKEYGGSNHDKHYEWPLWFVCGCFAYLWLLLVVSSLVRTDITAIVAVILCAACQVLEITTHYYFVSKVPHYNQTSNVDKVQSTIRGFLTPGSTLKLEFGSHCIRNIRCISVTIMLITQTLRHYT